MRKKIGFFATLLFLFLCGLFFSSWWNNGSEFLNERYGINPVLLTGLVIVTEIFFDIGIGLMLIGGGVHKLTIQEFLHFNFERVHFSGPLVRAGFWINRFVSTVPSSYVLAVGFSRLPNWVNFLVGTELFMVIVASVLIREFLLEKTPEKVVSSNN